MVCRWCGKKGFKKVKEIESSQNVIPDYMHEVCSFCKGRYIDKDTWDIWYKRGWTTKQKLKNKVQKILNLNDGSLSLNDIDDLYRSKNKKLEKKDLYKKKYNIYKGLSLIPDSIFGISIYVLIILFCIWIFGDFGGECGVDYAPRFFGEC